VSAATLVTHSIDEPGMYTGSFPALPHRDWQHVASEFRRLRALAARVAALERALRGAIAARRGNAMTLIEFEALLPQLPRRYPALLIDRLIECVPGKSARAMKCVTSQRAVLPGTLPRAIPVMPGVLVLEALIPDVDAAVGELGPVVRLGTVQTIDGVRFKRQVAPGDQLLLETQMHAPASSPCARASTASSPPRPEVVLVADLPLPCRNAHGPASIRPRTGRRLRRIGGRCGGRTVFDLVGPTSSSAPRR
jgi:3-hydroxyacyl-[acyl-carrier-protein] dehydratase